MMENLGIVLPGEIQMLLAKKKSLLDDIMKVKNMVNTYNTFISSMSNLEVSFLLKRISYSRGHQPVDCDLSKNIGGS